MDTSNIIALSAAGLSVIGTLVAIYNASSARKQADLAEETANAAIIQADSAEKQAVEAKRSADAAWAQLRGTNLDRLHSAFYEYLTAASQYRDAVSTATNLMEFDPADAGNTVIVDVIRKAVFQHPAAGILLGGLPDDSKIHKLVEDNLGQAAECLGFGLGVPMRFVLKDMRHELDTYREHAKEGVSRFGLGISRLESQGIIFFQEQYRRAHQGPGSPD